MVRCVFECVFGCVLGARCREGSRERERGSREGKVRKWIGEREREEVDTVGEMTVIENDVFTLYFY